MAVDVSVYNEIARNNDALTQCVSNAYTPCYILGYANGISAATTINTTGLSCQQVIYPIRLACDLIAQPWCCCYWAAIPTLPSITGGLFVCDVAQGFGNVCCAWTVPGGATFLRFQMWGAGAGSKGVNCCGISIYGGSGAYASVIIPAVPGCVYTLCAGCAYCSLQCDNVSAATGSGCSSYVIGYGLNNVCAEGGEASPWCWMKREKATNGVDDSNWSYCAMVPNSAWVCTVASKGTIYSHCMCAWGGFCFSGYCYLVGNHPFVTSCKTFRGNVTNASQCCHFVIGTPGSWACLNSPGSCYAFYSVSPPVTCITNCCNCQSWSGGLISPGYNCYGNAYLSYPCQMSGNAPGRGGLPSMASGGNCYPGFYGTGGAVCVQYL